MIELGPAFVSTFVDVIVFLLLALLRRHFDFSVSL